MPFTDLSKTERDELAASLSVLALFDAGVEITADALTKTFEASGNDVSAHVAPLFADLLGCGLDIEKLLAGPSAGAPPAAGAVPAPTGAAAAKVEEKPVEEEEEVEIGGMDMFGAQEDY